MTIIGRNLIDLDELLGQFTPEPMSVTYTDWSTPPDEQIIRRVTPRRHPAGALAKYAPGCPCTDTRLCPAHAAMIREGLRTSDEPGMYVVPNEDPEPWAPARRLFGFGGPW